MASRHWLTAVALVVSLSLAGCTIDSRPPESRWDGQPATTDTPAVVPQTDTPTDTPRVAVRGESLPVDADTVFARVETLTGASVAPPEVVVKPGRSGMPNLVAGQAVPTVFGLDGWEQGAGVHGKTAGDGSRVHLFLGNGTAPAVEHVLAHEFVHVVQLRTELPARAIRRGAATTDERLAATALVEGHAVYVADRYVERYLPGSRSQLAMLSAEYRRGPPGYRYFRSRYVFGGRYVHAMLDGQREVADLFADPPTETETIIHNGTDGPQPPLAVSVALSEPWTQPAGEGPWNDTQGELVVRNVLRSALSEPAAASGAAGWGTDRLYTVSHTDGSTAGIVWALRWENTSEASEFAATFERYADRQEPTAAYSYRLVTLGGETTVVLGGTGSLLENTRVAGSEANVTVALGAG